MFRIARLFGCLRTILTFISEFEQMKYLRKSWVTELVVRLFNHLQVNLILFYLIFFPETEEKGILKAFK